MLRFFALLSCCLLLNIPAPERLGELRKLECGADFEQEITVNSGDLIQITAWGAVVRGGKIDNLEVDIAKPDALKVQCLGNWTVPKFNESGQRIVGGLGMLEMVTLIKAGKPGAAVVKVTTTGTDVEGNTFEFKIHVVPAKT